MVAHPADVKHEGKLFRYADVGKYFGVGGVLYPAEQTHVVQMVVGKDYLFNIGQGNTCLLKSGNKGLKRVLCVRSCIKKGHRRSQKEMNICRANRKDGRRGNRVQG